jgi:hypothetical protein
MDAFRWAVVYLAFVQKAKQPISTLQALRCLADIHMSLKDDETTLHLFHAVLEAGTKMDIHRIRAECMVGIGEIMLRRGDPIQAKEMWEAAHPLLARSSQMKDAASVEKRLEQLPHTQQNNSHLLLATGDGVAEPTDSVSVPSQQDNSQSLLTIRDAPPDESTDSVSVVLKRSYSDSAAMEASLEKLEALSAPSTSFAGGEKRSVCSKFD